MRITGIKEFRNRVPELVSGNELVFVTKHGKLSGLLVPLGQPEEIPIELRRELLDRLGAAISRHLDERGVGEEQVTRDFETWKEKRRARSGRQ